MLDVEKRAAAKQSGYRDRLADTSLSGTDVLRGDFTQWQRTIDRHVEEIGLAGLFPTRHFQVDLLNHEQQIREALYDTTRRYYIIPPPSPEKTTEASLYVVSKVFDTAIHLHRSGQTDRARQVFQMGLSLADMDDPRNRHIKYLKRAGSDIGVKPDQDEPYEKGLYLLALLAGRHPRKVASFITLCADSLAVSSDGQASLESRHALAERLLEFARISGISSGIITQKTENLIGSENIGALQSLEPIRKMMDAVSRENGAEGKPIMAIVAKLVRLNPAGYIAQTRFEALRAAAHKAATRTKTPAGAPILTLAQGLDSYTVSQFVLGAQVRPPDDERPNNWTKALDKHLAAAFNKISRFGPGFWGVANGSSLLVEKSDEGQANAGPTHRQHYLKAIADIIDNALKTGSEFTEGGRQELMSSWITTGIVPPDHEGNASLLLVKETAEILGSRIGAWIIDAIRNKNSQQGHFLLQQLKQVGYLLDPNVRTSIITHLADQFDALDTNLFTNQAGITFDQVVVALAHQNPNTYVTTNAAQKTKVEEALKTQALAVRATAYTAYDTMLGKFADNPGASGKRSPLEQISRLVKIDQSTSSSPTLSIDSTNLDAEDLTLLKLMAGVANYKTENALPQTLVDQLNQDAQTALFLAARDAYLSATGHARISHASIIKLTRFLKTELDDKGIAEKTTNFVNAVKIALRNLRGQKESMQAGAGDQDKSEPATFQDLLGQMESDATPNEHTVKIIELLQAGGIARLAFNKILEQAIQSGAQGLIEAVGEQLTTLKLLHEIKHADQTLLAKLKKAESDDTGADLISIQHTMRILSQAWDGIFSSSYGHDKPAAVTAKIMRAETFFVKLFGLPSTENHRYITIPSENGIRGQLARSLSPDFLPAEMR